MDKCTVSFGEFVAYYHREKYLFILSMPPSFSPNYRQLIEDDQMHSVSSDSLTPSRAPLHHYLGLAAYTALAFVAGVLTIGNQTPGVLQPEHTQAQVLQEVPAANATSIELLPMAKTRFVVGEPVTITARVQGTSVSPLFQFEDQGIWQPDNGTGTCGGDKAGAQCEWSSTHVYQLPGEYVARAQLLGPEQHYSQALTITIEEPTGPSPL